MSEFGELKFKEEIVKKVMEKHKSKKTFAGVMQELGVWSAKRELGIPAILSRQKICEICGISELKEFQFKQEFGIIK